MSEDPIAYTALEPGTPVEAQGGEPVGRVERVLALDDADIFDGLLVRTKDGVRFVDADQVDAITTARVRLRLDAAAARRLPPPHGGPVEYRADPADGGWEQAPPR